MKTLDANRNRGNATMSFRAVAVLIALIASSDPTALASDRSTARYLDSSDGSDWPGYGRTFGEQHYSPLMLINASNIGRLSLAWSMDLSNNENSVTQPIAVEGVLYFATGYSIVHAVDAATGKLLWRYDPEAAKAAGLNLRLGWGSRGIAWWNGKIYTGTQDGRLIAVDAKTGAAIWSVQTFDRDSAAYITGAPRVFDGKVIIGYSSDSGPTRGYVTAYDAETGKLLWRFYTVPGNPALGFENKAMEMAAKTWAGEWWKLGGGGAVWNGMAYDAQSDTVYLGTGNGYPMNRRVRSQDTGDNLFLASIVALDGKTGAYKWHYQVNPGDTWDYDATMDIELADLAIGGKPRKALLIAPKSGFFYVIDRLTGKLLSAHPFAKVTWASGIDLTTGRPIENPQARYPNGSTVDLWPSELGAHGVMAMAYSPKTRLAYIPVAEMGATYTDKGIDPAHWRPPGDRTVSYSFDWATDPLQKNDGALVAWDPVKQEPAWKVSHPTPANGGLMATAGDLVFQGTIDGTFKAYSATTGKVMWSFAAQAPVMAASISYSALGVQYVTVLTGLGTGQGLLTAAMVPDAGQRYRLDPRSQARRVLTFALDGKAALPLPNLAQPPAVADAEFKPDLPRAQAGEAIYGPHCASCHGGALMAGIHPPDLRRSVIPLSAEAFAHVVRDGALAANGMPAFGEFTDEQLVNLRQYIRTEMQRLREGTGSAER